MLNLLDKEIEARNLHFTRYADDTIILVKSEKAANRVMTSITLHKDRKKKFQRTLKRLTNRSKSISLDRRFEELNWAIRGWVNYFRIAKMKTFLKETDEHLRARISLCPRLLFSLKQNL